MGEANGDPLCRARDGNRRGAPILDSFAEREMPRGQGKPLAYILLVGRVEIGDRASIHRARHAHFGIGICNAPLNIAQLAP